MAFTWNETPQSSNIYAIGYDEETEDLRVQFRNKAGERDREYEYAAVPESVYIEFVNAPSVGHYFREHIKDNYTCRRLA